MVRFALPAVLPLFLLVTGCAASRLSSSNPGSDSNGQITGHVLGGQQPVNGATIQLYAVGTAADGSSATPLLRQVVTTDVHGEFTITGLYSCTGATQVFLTVTGGDPGMGTPNSNLALMTALGACSSLSAQTFIAVNELTTVAAVSELAPYMKSLSAVGSSPADASSLAEAIVQSTQMVNTSTGVSPGVGVPAGLIVPVALLNTLADIIAPCVNSGGGTAGDSTACGQLFYFSTPTGGPAPTDTVAALLNIVASPTTNVTSLYGLITPDAPFLPGLSSSPSSLSVSLNVPIPERSNLLGEYLLNEGTGAVADDTSGKGNNGTIVGSPTWEGTQDLNFSAASGQYISVPAALNGLQTWQVVLYNPPFSKSGSSVGAAPVYTTPAVKSSILCGSILSMSCWIPNSYLTGQSMRFYAAGSDYTEASPYLQAGWHVVTFICGGSSAAAHILYDGTEVSGYVTQGTNSCPVSATGNFQFGGSNADGLNDEFFVGKIAGVWAWSTALSVPEAQIAAQAALNFMQAKGIPLTFTPVQATTPLIIVGLDSRTAGAGTGLTPATMWPFEMVASDPTYEVINVARGGQTVFDEVNEFNILYQLQFQPGTVPVIIILWGGINDYTSLSTLSHTAAANLIAANLHSMVTQAKAVGARIILATEISATNYNSLKDNLNPIIRSQAFGWGADNIADLATDPAMGADGAAANTTYFSDGLHPNSTLESHITSIMQNAVNELLGSTAANPHTTATANYSETAGDRFLTLTGPSTQIITLPDCTGFSLARQITNQGLLTATISTTASQTLTGSGSLAAGATGVFISTPGPVAAGGCSWTRTQ